MAAAANADDPVLQAGAELGGAAASLLVQYPLTVVKVFVQLSPHALSLSIWGAVKCIYAVGGVAGFWTGFVPGAAFAMVYMYLGSAVHRRVSPWILREPTAEEIRTNSFFAYNVRVSLASAVAAFTAASLAMPLASVRTRMLADLTRGPGVPRAFTGLTDAVYQSYWRLGLRGFYIGWMPFVGGVVAQELAYCVLYELVERAVWPAVVWIGAKLGLSGAEAQAIANAPEAARPMLARRAHEQDLERKRAIVGFCGTFVHYPFEVLARQQAVAGLVQGPDQSANMTALLRSRGALGVYKLFLVNQIVGWF